MPVKVGRIILVRAAEEHYHHQTELKNLTKQAILYYSCSLVQVMFAWQLKPCLVAHTKHMPEGDALDIV